MTAARKGDWIQTHLNSQFWPLDPRPEDVFLEDIAHALSNMCRFGGHCSTFYSVAQHSVLVSRQCRENPVAGLLHDATEAYLVDVPRPIKRDLVGYKEIEARLAVVIGERFGLCLEPLPEEVKEQDERALVTEKRDLRGPAPAPWSCWATPWRDRITPWSPEAAKYEFLRRACDLGVLGLRS